MGLGIFKNVKLVYLPSQTHLRGEIEWRGWLAGWLR